MVYAKSNLVVAPLEIEYCPVTVAHITRAARRAGGKRDKDYRSSQDNWGYAANANCPVPDPERTTPPNVTNF